MLFFLNRIFVTQLNIIHTTTSAWRKSIRRTGCMSSCTMPHWGNTVPPRWSVGYNHWRQSNALRRPIYDRHLRVRFTVLLLLPLQEVFNPPNLTGFKGSHGISGTVCILCFKADWLASEPPQLSCAVEGCIKTQTKRLVSSREGDQNSRAENSASKWMYFEPFSFKCLWYGLSYLFLVFWSHLTEGIMS